MILTVLHLRSSKGEPYRKTLQYGFDLQQSVDRRMGQKLNGLDPYRDPVRDKEIFIDMYACGLLRPKYPVPCVIKT